MQKNVSNNGNMFKEIIIVFQKRKSWVCHKNCYNLCKTNNFGSNFRNFLLFNSVNISKSKKLSAKPNSFWELGSRVPPLFPALVRCKGGGAVPLSKVVRFEQGFCKTQKL